MVTSTYRRWLFRSTGLREYCGYDKVRVQSVAETTKMTLQAGIFPENKPSLTIHEVCGFRVVGVRQKLGKLAGVWRDVALLERRSSRVGT